MGNDMSIMNPLEPPDLHHFRSAEGWMELGNPREALADLARLSPESWPHPDVQLLRWNVYARLKDWPACLAVAREMIQADPHNSNGWINQSNALYFSGCAQEAYNALHKVIGNFPGNASFPYNLACYAAQLGQLELAWDWLLKAFQISPPDKMKELALSDHDLEPLWPQIRNL